MPATPKDHKPKADFEELEEYFSFTIGEERYVMPLKTRDVMTPGWVRKNRRRDQVDYLMSLMENLCGFSDRDPVEGVGKDELKVGEAVLDALDAVSWAEHRRIQEEIGKHIGATLGE